MFQFYEPSWPAEPETRIQSLCHSSYSSLLSLCSMKRISIVNTTNTQQTTQSLLPTLQQQQQLFQWYFYSIHALIINMDRKEKSFVNEASIKRSYSFFSFFIHFFYSPLLFLCNALPICAPAVWCLYYIHKILPLGKVFFLFPFMGWHWRFYTYIIGQISLLSIHQSCISIFLFHWLNNKGVGFARALLLI